MSPSLSGAAETSHRPGWAALFLVPVAAALSPFDHVLAGMVAAGHGLDAICFFLDIAGDALLDRIVALGLATPHDRAMRRPSGKRPWLASDVQHLIRMWISGVRVVSIAGQTGRSPGSVSAKARRLGLPKRDRTKLYRLTGSDRPRNESNCPAAPSPKAEPIKSFIGSSVAAGAAGHAGDSVAPRDPPIRPFLVPLEDLASMPERPAQPPSYPQDVGGDVRVARTRRDDDPPSVLALHKPAKVVQPLPGPNGVALDKRGQSRPGEKTWSKELDLELSIRAWANQHPGAIAKEMQKYGPMTPRAISSRLSRLQIPRRDRAELVDDFDRALGEKNLKASGYILRFCSIKKRSFWAQRNGPQRFCREALKSAQYRELTGGMD